MMALKRSNKSKLDALDGPTPEEQVAQKAEKKKAEKQKKNDKKKQEPKKPEGPMVPAAAFDLLHGQGRKVQATKKLNKWLAIVAIIAVGASVMWAGWLRSTQSSLEDEQNALQNEIAQLNSDIVRASNSILSEEVLRTHRDTRREGLYQTAMQQLPYEIVISDMFQLGEELGMSIRSVQFQGNNRDGLAVNGTAPSLETIGEWSTALQQRHGMFQVGGYIESVTNSYQAAPGSVEQQFSTRITPNTEALQQYAACWMVRPFTVDGGSVADCDDVFRLFESIEDEDGRRMPDVSPIDTNGDGVADLFEFSEAPTRELPEFFNRQRWRVSDVPVSQQEGNDG